METQHGMGTLFPRVQQFTTASEDRWKPAASSKILIISNAKSSGNPRLDDTVSLLQSEFAAKRLPTENKLPLQYGAIGDAAPGDLVIELAEPPETSNPEGCTIDIGSFVKVTAPGERAVMYGVRTVLQQLLRKGYLPCGKAVDYPAVQERALHVDMGRKFFTAEWIVARIKEMSWLKLNALQLHFSENEGFTLRSDRHPEVMSPEYLTKEQMREIARVAERYHVTLIPSLDSPGHLGYALRNHPDWLLKDTNGVPAKGALDITNPHARAFVLDLIDEYAELFQASPYFHIGGDEFIDFEKFDAYPQLASYARETLGIQGGTGVDAYIDYVNDIADHLERKGFVVRAWNDGLYRADQTERAALKSTIQIAYWTKWHRNMARVEAFMDKGHDLLNYNDSYFYYVLGENAGYKYPKGEKIYDSWHPGVFPRVSEAERQEYARPYPDALIGCSFAIWSDKPSAQTEAEVSAGIAEPLRAMAEKSWLAEKRYGSYEEFKAAFTSL
ncbi:family 20 glycosylhydrolase [Paenibacillus macerans]|uniref:Family 20 glycosylhydrolase n=1 Tax=Paenibacillus macerans TaxID=44252 RepID=A0A6N8EPD4_PAEMA|nr:glycoside hydrolase family 20 protein [Paenibacillus macerans]MUG21455.1 family 20 glycosylhydrolase [Paenibacillus macerans]